MVLLLKQWKSRSSPGFAGGVEQNPFAMFTGPLPGDRAAAFLFGAGWSSPVARQAHNLKVAGSNPAPATNKRPASERAFLLPVNLSPIGTGRNRPLPPSANERHAIVP